MDLRRDAPRIAECTDLNSAASTSAVFQRQKPSAMSGVIDGGGFHPPSKSKQSKLGSLFSSKAGASGEEGMGQLQYRPRTPTPNQHESRTTQNEKPLRFAAPIKLFCYKSASPTVCDSLGPLGLVIMIESLEKWNEDKSSWILIYDPQTKKPLVQHYLTGPMASSNEVESQSDLFFGFYDAAGNFWTCQFESNSKMADCLKSIALLKYSAHRPSDVMTTTLSKGEGDVMSFSTHQAQVICRISTLDQKRPIHDLESLEQVFMTPKALQVSQQSESLFPRMHATLSTMRIRERRFLIIPAEHNTIASLKYDSRVPLSVEIALIAQERVVDAAASEAGPSVEEAPTTEPKMKQPEPQISRSRKGSSTKEAILERISRQGFNPIVGVGGRRHSQESVCSASEPRHDVAKPALRPKSQPVSRSTSPSPTRRPATSPSPGPRWEEAAERRPSSPLEYTRERGFRFSAMDSVLEDVMAEWRTTKRVFREQAAALEVARDERRHLEKELRRMTTREHMVSEELSMVEAELRDTVSALQRENAALQQQLHEQERQVKRVERRTSQQQADPANLEEERKRLIKRLHEHLKSNLQASTLDTFDKNDVYALLKQCLRDVIHE